MKSFFTVGITSLVFTLLAGPLQAGEGKTLYNENCTKCHNSEVFTREDRGIKNLDALKIRVKQCTGAAEVKWTPEQIQVVADYLNKDFYKF